MEKWVLTLKEISSHIFKLFFYFKFHWGFHDPNNQVNTAKKMKLFPEVFINKMFEHTFVIFVSNQSFLKEIYHFSVGYYSYSRGELWCAATDFIFHFEYRRNFLYYFAQDCCNTSLIAIYYFPQCPRRGLSKRFLPRAKITTVWKPIPHRSKISKNWNPPDWVSHYRFFKNWFLLIQ